MLGEMTHIPTKYLAHEEKVVVASSKVEALEVDGSTLRKGLILEIGRASCRERVLVAV